MSDVFDLQGRVTVDLSEVDQVPEDIQQALTGLSSTLALNVDDTQAKAQVATIGRNLKTLSATKSTPQIKVDATPALHGIDEIQAHFLRQKQQIESMAIKVQATTEMKAMPAKRAEGLGNAAMDLQMMLGGALAGAGVGALGRSAISSAADEERMKASVSRIFGASGAEMTDFAAGLSKSTGYLTTDLLQSEAAISDIGDTLGITDDQVKALLTTVTGLAASNGLPQFKDQILAVTEAVGRGMTTGETRGLKMLGINVSEAYMKTVYLNGALKNTWATMDVAAKQQAYMNTILQQTADVANAASADTDGYAKSSRDATRAIHEATEEIGAGLLPVVAAVAKVVAKIPKPVMEVGIAGGAVAATGIAGLAAAAMGKGLIGGVKGLFGGAAAAAELEAGAAAAATTLEAGATAAAATLEGGAVASTAATSAAAVTGATSVALAIIPVVMAAALAYEINRLKGQTTEANNQANTQTVRGVELEQILTAKKTGMGNMADPEQARYVRAGTKRVDGQYVDFNVYGQRLNAAAAQWQGDLRTSQIAQRDAALAARTQVTVTLNDRTSGGVQARQTNAGSFAPSAH